MDEIDVEAVFGDATTGPNPKILGTATLPSYELTAAYLAACRADVAVAQRGALASHPAVQQGPCRLREGEAPGPAG